VAGVRSALVLVAVVLALALGVLVGRGWTDGHAQLKAANSHPTRGAHVVSTIQQSTGSSYVKSQRSLPNQISIP
jgi:hypothetical protein